MNDVMREVQVLTLNTADGLCLPARYWPVVDPYVTLAIIHGLGEHSGRYQRFAALANRLGVAVICADLRGHGSAPGDSCRIERFDDYLSDADALIAAAHGFSSGPLFLMGHSMGGAIALRWLLQRPTEVAKIAGLVLSSAALKIGPDISPLLLALAPLVGAVAPGLRLQPIDPKLISRIPEEVAAYSADPLIAHRPPPARTAAELLRVLPLNMANAAQMTLPLYALHGDADRLTAPQGSTELVERWGGTDKTLRLWPGSFHETLNDRDGTAVADELLAWVLARALSPAQATQPPQTGNT
jgi:alpha-beta hydrolase superfamily lysophospholipase